MHMKKLGWRDRLGAGTVCCIATFCFFLAAILRPTSGAPPGNRQSPANVQQVLQDVVRNEERARQDPRDYFKFIQKETTSKGSETSIRIETPQGEVGEAISVNGKPPSQERCRADSNSLKKLATDQQALQDQLQEQEEETARINKLIEAVPDAFIFQYIGKQRSSGWLKIAFRPNPRFQPRSREASLLKGMQGTLWVDPASHRLAKIDGTLVKDVKFGWGFLASFRRGGHFAMQQSRIADGSWRQTYLEVDFDGSKLLFGTLNVHLKEWSRSFVRLDYHPTLAQAVDILERSQTACRENQTHEVTAQTSNRQ